MQHDLVLRCVSPEPPQRVLAEVGGGGAQQHVSLLAGARGGRDVADARVRQRPREVVKLLVGEVDAFQVERPQAADT